MSLVESRPCRRCHRRWLALVHDGVGTRDRMSPLHYHAAVSESRYRFLSFSNRWGRDLPPRAVHDDQFDFGHPLFGGLPAVAVAAALLPLDRGFDEDTLRPLLFPSPLPNCLPSPAQFRPQARHSPLSALSRNLRESGGEQWVRGWLSRSGLQTTVILPSIPWYGHHQIIQITDCPRAKVTTLSTDLGPSASLPLVPAVHGPRNTSEVWETSPPMNDLPLSPFRSPNTFHPPQLGFFGLARLIGGRGCDRRECCRFLPARGR